MISRTKNILALGLACCLETMVVIKSFFIWLFICLFISFLHVTHQKVSVRSKLMVIKMSSFPDILNPGENRIADKMLSTLVHCSLSDGDVHVMCSGCPVLLVPV